MSLAVSPDSILCAAYEDTDTSSVHLPLLWTVSCGHSLCSHLPVSATLPTYAPGGLKSLQTCLTMSCVAFQTLVFSQAVISALELTACLGFHPTFLSAGCPFPGVIPAVILGLYFALLGFKRKHSKVRAPLYLCCRTLQPLLLSVSCFFSWC